MKTPDDTPTTPDEAAVAEQEALLWEDLVFSEPLQPPLYEPPPTNFDDTPPPQLVRTVNLLPIPDHGLSGPDDVDGIAEAILRRAREGIDDIFAHEDYAGFESEPTEAWARAIAEHQTGIPYTMPAYFYGAQKKVAESIVTRGRYPLVGQCQQSVTTALCIGGWNGGTYGDIGAGKDAQPFCSRLGQGWKNVPLDLKKWSDELWDEVKVGSCLFWSDETNGSGHVVMVIRKHPTDRKWQLWDTGTSFHDPSKHTAAAKQARMLWESHWWDYIPPRMSTDWVFRGIGLIHGLGEVKRDLKPRGQARLLLTRRSDKKLLFRSEWIDMEAEGLPITWLLRALRGAPFSDQIEAKFCVNSPSGQVRNFPKGAPLLDCIADPRGNASMTWSWQWKQGYHDRKDAAAWQPDAPYREGRAGSPKATANAAAAPAQKASVRPEEDSPYDDEEEPILRSAPLRGVAEFQRIAAGQGSLAQGARGAGAKALQQALISLHIQVPGGADGIFGKGTAEAVKKLQTQAGLDATGVVDAETVKALDARL